MKSRYKSMNYKMILATVSLALAHWACDSAESYAAPRETRCGDEVLSASEQLAKGKKVVITLKQRPYGCGTPLSGRYWGETDIPPRKIVSGMQVVLGSGPVTIYASALAGLGDIDRMQVIQKNNAFVIRLIGVGEESYFADLTIVGGNLTSRKVYYRLFSDSAYEETRYHFTVK